MGCSEESRRSQKLRVVHESHHFEPNQSVTTRAYTEDQQFIDGVSLNEPVLRIALKSGAYSCIDEQLPRVDE